MWPDSTNKFRAGILTSYHLQHKCPMSYIASYRQGQLAKVACGTCKIVGMVAFCFGVNLAQVPSWVANDIDSHIDWIWWDAPWFMGIALWFFTVIASYMNDAAIGKFPFSDSGELFVSTLPWNILAGKHL